MLRIIKTGLFTTLQDLGRFGYRDKGVPVSGVMDSYAVTTINNLLENKREAAVLEITMTGPVLEFKEETYICLGGAQMSATVNEEQLLNNKVYHIKAGDKLSYGKLQKGLRAYLAIKGGFKSSKVLGSSSYYKSITTNSLVEKETVILYDKCSFFDEGKEVKENHSYLDEKVLKVYKGPEFNQLDDKQLEMLFFKSFTIAKENNRMAYQLKETIKGHNVSMLTSTTLSGTIQFTPSGKLIILMKDAQTTGGYPRILQLTEMAICILSQKKYGDKISFKLL